MKVLSQEHYQLMAQFERSHSGRFDREDKSLWPKGIIYQDGRVNEMFLAYRNGYAFCEADMRSDLQNLEASRDGYRADAESNAKDAERKAAGNIQEPLNGDGWHVVWWNESMRLMLPDGSRLDRFQGYRNGTMQLTIKTDAAIAAQQGNKTGTNSGHGHVWERPDGFKAKCGGPGFCAQCSRDQASQQGEGGGV